MAILSGWDTALDTSNLPFHIVLKGQIMLYRSDWASMYYSTGERSGYISGADLTFAPPNSVTGGNVTGMRVQVGPQVVFAMRLSESATDLFALGGLGPRQIASTLLSRSDSISGSFRSDKLEGFAGHDRIRGQIGGDTLIGGEGNDVLIGGAGRDVMTGGAGDDRFRFERVTDSLPFTRDVVTDFRRGADKLDLSMIDADQSGTAGNQSFVFIGGREFSGQAGELRFAAGVVSGDVNGDGGADFAIRVVGPSILRGSDFVL